ncbi:bioD [Wigglesworthia glossinidia endosymbiont of Glossina brevipalpis]|uniref:ATP-dependent dethiobiotin synthetase BioD n=1 Tax=Wigglesworthia glossinidia brevipalpis TaxID=36870 RepID=BIOD_WIGBR|nr:RecName: Full=ATP-dependent dethiobiotin synthetase BioD; AltName: Full=DTB synthetase; Short=DTBS; AltName: Full=Dethiobiotin synthase [Wigglesworthia glossinidia endosymbiont of Glossina brevipalpis]BAC24602.1 bioD [Wigglesworthia glossinidia endosymbiont of Glossina brevipalpis]
MINRYFITGTDTNIGKTISVCALLQYLNKLGNKSVGCKLISSGCKKIKNKIFNEDVVNIMKYNNIKFKYKDINPFAFLEKTAPHIASKRKNIFINHILLSNKLNKFLNYDIDYLIIEGFGGWKVPINSNSMYSEWVSNEKLPIILVVGIKLGCINHALLTIESIKNSNAIILGWIANHLEKDLINKNDYFKYLKKVIKYPLIGKIPFIKNKKNFSNLHKYIFLKKVI